MFKRSGAGERSSYVPFRCLKDVRRHLHRRAKAQQEAHKMVVKERRGATGPLRLSPAALLTGQECSAAACHTGSPWGRCEAEH